MPPAPHQSSWGVRVSWPLLPLIAIASLVGSPVAAQNGESAGQWWWDATLSLGQKIREASTDGRQFRSNRQSTLTASFGVNGYIVHPSFARFRLVTDVRTNRYSGAGSKTTNAGFGFDLKGLPRGRTPFALYFKKQFLDYSDSIQGAGLAEGNTVWGGSLLLRDKFPGRLFLSLSHSEIEYADEDSVEETDRRKLQWDGATKRSSQAVHLEQRSQDLPRAGLDLEDLTARIDNRTRFGTGWLWQLGGFARNQSTASGSQAPIRSRALRFFNTISGPIGDRDRLDIDLRNGRLFPNWTEPTRTLGASARINWSVRERLLIVPSVQYSALDTGDFRLRDSSAGLDTNWSRDGSRVSGSLGAGLGYGTVARENDTGKVNTPSARYRLSASLSHGDTVKLRTSLSFDCFANEFRLDRDIDLGLIDRDLLGGGLGVQDQCTGRVEFSKRWSGQSGRLWFRHDRFGSSDDLSTTGLRNRSNQAGVRIGWNKWTGQALLGRKESRVTSGSTGSEVAYLTSTFDWRANRYLALRGSVRINRSELRFAEDTSGVWIEASASFRLGVFSFEASAYDREQTYSESTRSDRGFTFTFRGYYADWLPIITGTRRRGVIR